MKTPWVSEKMAAKRVRRVQTAPISVRPLLERIYAGRTSPRACIKGMCLECVGFDRAAVTECEAAACPLWNVRPFQAKDKIDG